MLQKKLPQVVIMIFVITSLILAACSQGASTPPPSTPDPRLDQALTAIAIQSTTIAQLSVPATPQLVCDPSACPVVQSTPTTMCIDSKIVYLVGGRWIGSENKGIEYIAKTTKEWILSGSALQPYYSQLISADFQNTTGVKIESNEEILNDGVQWIIYTENCRWQVFEVSRNEKDLIWFGNLSFIQGIPKGDLGFDLCVNDTGDAGSFIGGGESCNFQFGPQGLEYMKSISYFQPYVAALETAMQNTALPINKIQLVAVFTK